jgi:hypothetical protein
MRFLHVLLVIACIPGCLWLAGCNIISAVAIVAGRPPVDPEFVPPQTPMLVLAENYSSHGPSLQAEQLERHVTAELIRYNIAPIAENTAVYELRVADPEKFRKMSITALGKLANASQVLYISTQMDAGDIAAGAGMYKGQGSAYVRVVDVASGATLWPDDGSKGFPVRVETKFSHSPGADPQGKIEHSLQADLAVQIVRLFRRYKPDDFEE